MTAQCRERLIYNGEEYYLATEPLAPYLVSHKIRFTAPHTACWRGYIGSWLIEDNKLYLVDLPGYGYHKASKGIANAWDNVMNDYFSDNPNLKLVLLLLDSRILATDLDKQMMDYLFEKQIPALIVLTKADKINQSEKYRISNNIKKRNK